LVENYRNAFIFECLVFAKQFPPKVQNHHFIVLNSLINTLVICREVKMSHDAILYT